MNRWTEIANMVESGEMTQERHDEIVEMIMKSKEQDRNRRQVRTDDDAAYHEAMDKLGDDMEREELRQEDRYIAETAGDSYRVRGVS